VLRGQQSNYGKGVGIVGVWWENELVSPEVGDKAMAGAIFTPLWGGGGKKAATNPRPNG